jgi:hypothetical protein
LTTTYKRNNNEKAETSIQKLKYTFHYAKDNAILVAMLQMRKIDIPALQEADNK